MATSEGLSNVNPWSYRQGLNVDDSSLLLPDTFSHDTDLLVRALHTTLTSPHYTLTPSFDSPLVSHSSSKRKRDCLLTKSPRKRRSRASKKPQTTFIAADPSNFRQMVQQVTGANYIHDSSFGISSVPILKTEPLRLVNKLPCAPADPSTAAPMLDTSAFLPLQHQENLPVINTYAGNTTSANSNAVVDATGSASEFATYNSTFPTLESWKIM